MIRGPLEWGNRLLAEHFTVGDKVAFLALVVVGKGKSIMVCR